MFRPFTKISTEKNNNASSGAGLVAMVGGQRGRNNKNSSSSPATAGGGGPPEGREFPTFVVVHNSCRGGSREGGSRGGGPGGRGGSRGGGPRGRGEGGRAQPQRDNDCSGFQNSEAAVASGVNAVNKGTQPQQQVVDPPKWGTSAAKAFLRQELLKEDSIYWTLTPKDAFASNKLFFPFKYKNFVTNFRNLKCSIMGEVAAISFDDDAVKREQAAFPLSEVDRRGNKRFHNHPARQLLIDDIKNGAGITYFNRPRDLRKTFGFGKVRVDTQKGIVFAQNNLQYFYSLLHSFSFSRE